VRVNDRKKAVKIPPNRPTTAQPFWICNGAKAFSTLPALVENGIAVPEKGCFPDRPTTDQPSVKTDDSEKSKNQ
jgi:hypothetical protein